MRHPLDLLRLQVSVSNPGFLAFLILFLVAIAGAQEIRPPQFAVKPLPLPGALCALCVSVVRLGVTYKRCCLTAGQGKRLLLVLGSSS